MSDTMISSAAVRFVKELYPRLDHDEAAIERYRLAIDRLKPIVVARGGILVDGYHRWQAHRREELSMIRAEDLGDLSDEQILRESIRRNADHGVQLSKADKAKLAKQLWPTFAQDGGVDALAELLSVGKRAVEMWTKEARDAQKAELRERAWDLWLDCWDQKAIAELIKVSPATITNWFNERKAAFSESPPESRQHFDVWQLPGDDDSAYFGRLPAGLVDNLLWLYTEPFQTVVDPFAGRGTTVKVAKRMGRRVWASDRQGNRWDETLPIHQHDITAGWPAAAPRKADLILLDPPYWQQAKGRYSDDGADLGNKTLDEFNADWRTIAKMCMEHTGRVAYIISPTQLADGSVVDHATGMLQPFLAEGWRVERRIIVPYSTQQATGQQVTWARENRRLLKLYRDLVVLTP